MRQRDKLSQDESLAPFMWMDNAPSLYIKKNIFLLGFTGEGARGRVFLFPVRRKQYRVASFVSLLLTCPYLL